MSVPFKVSFEMDGGKLFVISSNCFTMVWAEGGSEVDFVGDAVGDLVGDEVGDPLVNSLAMK